MRDAMTARAPWDVHALRGDRSAFPHHSTVDQLYTDQKSELPGARARAAGRAMKAMKCGV